MNITSVLAIFMIAAAIAMAHACAGEYGAGLAILAIGAAMGSSTLGD